MDPVVVLAARIRNAEMALYGACKLNDIAYTAARAEAIVRLLADIRGLYASLSEVLPTSLAGAGEQIGFAAERLPYSHARHADGLRKIAVRFAAGHSMSADLIWLRTLIRSLKVESHGPTKAIAAALLETAVDGVARPVIIHRCARPERPRALALPRLEKDRPERMKQAGGGLLSGI